MRAAALAIEAHESGQVHAEQSLGAVMQRLLGARSDAEAHIRRVSEARVEQSTITERVPAARVRRAAARGRRRGSRGAPHGAARRNCDGPIRDAIELRDSIMRHRTLAR